MASFPSSPTNIKGGKHQKRLDLQLSLYFPGVNLESDESSYGSQERPETHQANNWMGGDECVWRGGREFSREHGLSMRGEDWIDDGDDMLDDFYAHLQEESRNSHFTSQLSGMLSVPNSFGGLGSDVSMIAALQEKYMNAGGVAAERRLMSEGSAGSDTDYESCDEQGNQGKCGRRVRAPATRSTKESRLAGLRGQYTNKYKSEPNPDKPGQTRLVNDDTGEVVTEDMATFDLQGWIAEIPPGESASMGNDDIEMLQTAIKSFEDTQTQRERTRRLELDLRAGKSGAYQRLCQMTTVDSRRKKRDGPDLISDPPKVWPKTLDDVECVQEGLCPFLGPTLVNLVWGVYMTGHNVSAKELDWSGRRERQQVWEREQALRWEQCVIEEQARISLERQQYMTARLAFMEMEQRRKSKRNSAKSSPQTGPKSQSLTVEITDSSEDAVAKSEEVVKSPKRKGRKARSKSLAGRKRRSTTVGRSSAKSKRRKKASAPTKKKGVKRKLKHKRTRGMSDPGRRVAHGTEAHQAQREISPEEQDAPPETDCNTHDPDILVLDSSRNRASGKGSYPRDWGSPRTPRMPRNRQQSKRSGLRRYLSDPLLSPDSLEKHPPYPLPDIHSHPGIHVAHGQRHTSNPIMQRIYAHQKEHGMNGMIIGPQQLSSRRGNKRRSISYTSEDGRYVGFTPYTRALKGMSAVRGIDPRAKRILKKASTRFHQIVRERALRCYDTRPTGYISPRNRRRIRRRSQPNSMALGKNGWSNPETWWDNLQERSKENKYRSHLKSKLQLMGLMPSKYLPHKPQSPSAARQSTRIHRAPRPPNTFHESGNDPLAHGTPTKLLENINYLKEHEAKSAHKEHMKRINKIRTKRYKSMKRQVESSNRALIETRRLAAPRVPAPTFHRQTTI